jgi:hypothetical protein
MRKGILIVAMLIAVAVPVAIAATAARDDESGGQTKRAKLEAMSTQPLRVRGKEFVPGERVRVTLKLVLGKTMTRRVTAGRRGGFVVNFGEVNTCNGFTVGAIGSRNSRATLSFQYSSFVCQ